MRSPLLRSKSPFRRAAASIMAAHQVVAVGVQHPPGVGGRLMGRRPPSPGGLDQMGGLGAEHIVPPGKEGVGVVGVGGQGQLGKEVLQGLGVLGPPGAAVPGGRRSRGGSAPPSGGAGYTYTPPGSCQDTRSTPARAAPGCTFQLLVKAHDPSPPMLRSLPQVLPHGPDALRRGDKNGVFFR